MPDKPKLIVIDSGDKPKTEIKWQCYEYIGVEILRAPPGMTQEELVGAKIPEGFTPEPITEREGIEEGSVVLIPGLFGDIGVYRIQTMSDGQLCGRSGGCAAFLDYAPDERKSWVCVGMGNLDAIRRLELVK